MCERAIKLNVSLTYWWIKWSLHLCVRHVEFEPGKWHESDAIIIQCHPHLWWALLTQQYGSTIVQQNEHFCSYRNPIIVSFQQFWHRGHWNRARMITKSVGISPANKNWNKIKFNRLNEKRDKRCSDSQQLKNNTKWLWGMPMSHYRADSKPSDNLPLELFITIELSRSSQSMTKIKSVWMAVWCVHTIKIQCLDKNRRSQRKQKSRNSK